MQILEQKTEVLEFDGWIKSKLSSAIRIGRLEDKGEA